MTAGDEKRNTAAAFIVGGLVGAVIALLLAPKSGAGMRRDIRRFGEKAVDKTQALRLELSRSIDKLADGVWERLQEDIAHGRDWTEHTLSEVQHALDAGKDFIRGEIDKIRQI